MDKMIIMQLKNKSRIPVTIVCFAIVSFLFANYAVQILTRVFDVETNTKFSFSSLGVDFFAVVILAPVVGTLIFQHRVIQSK